MIALAVDADRTWMTAAACRNTNQPDLWFRSVGPPDPLAVAICRQCPVQQQCEAYADAHHEQHGVWGGHTRDPRGRRARIREAQHG